MRNDAAILVGYLLTLAGASPDQTITGVVEATGRYHYPLLDAAVAIGFDCLVYNPILTKQGIKASVRGKKTDKTDAILIARMGVRGEGRIYTPEPYMTTKLQVRSYRKLGEMKTSFAKHTAHLHAMSEVVMTEQVTAVFQAVEEAIEQARAVLYADLTASAQGDVFTNLQTIPGIGLFVASCLIGEIQDMARFRQAKHLIAYVGFDPRVRQSGHTLNNTGRLTKRGSPHARRALFIAATVATCALARKLLLIVRAVWLSGGVYDAGLGET